MQLERRHIYATPKIMIIDLRGFHWDKKISWKLKTKSREKNNYREASKNRRCSYLRSQFSARRHNDREGRIDRPGWLAPEREVYSKMQYNNNEVLIWPICAYNINNFHWA